MSATVVFFTALLSLASPIKTISPEATVADVALLGEITKVDENAPCEAVAPPDNPEVPAVVIVTALMSPVPIKATKLLPSKKPNSSVSFKK